MNSYVGALLGQLPTRSYCCQSSRKTSLAIYHVTALYHKNINFLYESLVRGFRVFEIIFNNAPDLTFLTGSRREFMCDLAHKIHTLYCLL